ncbi:hypothetical protein [Chamaesiphon polymorphus]|uniref:Uncharacterized protein n=1 Tax=Chamaesiphon polymorphus CCALA 037 TaxID=2107692 RepID=A0A2T1F7K0_9CYAN|nr:hypothetical protein [Chamaesiphon polymorphus]PSB40888.1 hypothetical protein C7B77_27895 [Chamaesiphon polymorphus CCALA 037]
MSQITLTDNAQKVIDWSKSFTSSSKNDYDPLARELLAILFVVDLKSFWLHTRLNKYMGHGAIIRAKILKLVDKLDPQLRAKTDLARQQEQRQETRDSFVPLIDVAKIYKQDIFGVKGSFVTELRNAARFAPNMQSKEQEFRDYNERLTAIWHELVSFPDEILCPTNNGMTFNFSEDDFKAIERYIDSLS